MGANNSAEMEEKHDRVYPVHLIVYEPKDASTVNTTHKQYNT